jgi:SAM-dependent methyltransferase
MLSVSEEAVPVLFNRNDKNDALEAVLKCDRCSELYPIIRGVLILPPDMEGYIRDNYSHICRAIVENAIPDQSIPPQMIEFLIERGGRDARPSAPDFWDQNLPSVLSRYVQAHYGNMTELLEMSPSAWPDFVRAYKDSGSELYEVLISMARDAASGIQGLFAGMAIDVGCSVGRLAYELAPSFRSVYGIDLCFSAVLSARRIIRRSPIPQTTYSLVTDAGMWSDPIPVQVDERSNIEFLVASATALPLETGSVDCLATVNLIDVLPQPEELFKEAARVLGEQQFLLMADPYCWKDAGEEQAKKQKSSSNYVSKSLSEHGFTISQRKNSIPWLLRLHDRRWDIYLCDCFGAVKTTDNRKSGKI